MADIDKLPPDQQNDLDAFLATPDMEGRQREADAMAERANVLMRQAGIFTGQQAEQEALYSKDPDPTATRIDMLLRRIETLEGALAAVPKPTPVVDSARVVYGLSKTAYDAGAATLVAGTTAMFYLCNTVGTRYTGNPILIAHLAANRATASISFLHTQVVSILLYDAPWIDTEVVVGVILSDRGPGTFVTPYDLDVADFTSLTADTDTWYRAAQPTGKDGVKYSGPRIAYDTTTHKYWQFTRVTTYDSAGGVATIGAETKREVIDLVNCNLEA